MPNISDLQQLEKDIIRLERLQRAKVARESFFLFSRYIIGYNDKPNLLVVPHVHGVMCHKLQYTLNSIDDVGGFRLEGVKGTVYDTFNRIITGTESPHATLNSESELPERVPPNSSAVEIFNRVPVKEGEGLSIDKGSNKGNNHINGESPAPASTHPVIGDGYDSPKENAITESIVPPDDSSGSFSYGDNFNIPPPSGEIKKFLLELLPRGTFKSTVGTEGFPLYAWLFNPNLRVHIASETYGKALSFVGAIKGQMETNPRYREIFHTIYGTFPNGTNEPGKSETRKWNQDELSIAARTNLGVKEESLSCSGPDKATTGMHYDIIILDDLIGFTNYNTEGGLEKALAYYRGLLSLLEPGGILVVIGTRWDYRDIYGYILENEMSRFDVLIKSAYNEDGSLLFPERLDEEFLSAQRKSQGSKFFTSQYLNKIIDDETADFKSEYLRVERVDLENNENPINLFMAIDPVPPKSDERNNPDWFAIVVGGIGKQGQLYYVDGWRARPSPKEAIDRIFDMYDRWKPRLISFEKVGFSNLYMFMLKDEMRNRGVYLPIREMKRGGRRSKEERIRRLAPYYENYSVIHREGAGCLTALEDELLQFPRSSHDDLVDAFADIIEIGYGPGKLSDPVKREERKKLRERAKTLLRPRNRITGV